MVDVAVIGAGTMGHALALVFALGGHRVRLTDSSAAMLERAPGLMATALATLAEAGEVDAAQDRQWLSQAVRCDPSLSRTVDAAELVVEAIVEQPEAKRRLYAELDGIMSQNAILASNTSYLDIFPLVPERRLPRTLIAHWYTPPYLIDLCDVVPGPQTDPAVTEHVRAMIAAMGKVPVVFRKFVAGYVANRIQAAIAAEVYRLLDDGVVTPRDIDQSVIHGLSLRMFVLAVLAKADFTGLPLLKDALANKTYEPPPLRDTSDTLDRLVADGRTGVMAGKGFFDWEGRSAEDLFRDRDHRLIKLKKAFREIGPMEGT